LTRPKAGALPGIGDIQAMWQASGLKSKLLFTALMVVVFRLGIQVPIWGVDPLKLQTLLDQHANVRQLIGFLDMFSGGAFSSVSVLALGIGPYITASIIMQLLTVVIPRLEELQKEEGEAGRRKISQYTRYLTVFLALFQGALILRLLAGAGAIYPEIVANGASLAMFYAQAILSLTAGALFALWVAEMITERGVGNGGSLLIFIGIVSRIPIYWGQTEQLVANDGGKSFALVLLLLVYLVTVGLIIILQEATRKIFIVSAKRQVGNRIYGGQNTHIPFKINPSGVMPIIFAFAVLAFPSTIMGIVQDQYNRQQQQQMIQQPVAPAPAVATTTAADASAPKPGAPGSDELPAAPDKSPPQPASGKQPSPVAASPASPAVPGASAAPAAPGTASTGGSLAAPKKDFLGNFIAFYLVYLAPGKPAYIALEFLLIVFFTFFYASIVPSMQPKEIADNLKKYGSSIPGIKPGRPTAEKLSEILSRTTCIGAFGLAAITLVASSATSWTHITTLAGLGATSLLIMVGVALDTVNQIRVHLLARQYEGFLK